MNGPIKVDMNSYFVFIGVDMMSARKHSRKKNSYILKRVQGARNCLVMNLNSSRICCYIIFFFNFPLQCVYFSWNKKINLDIENIMF